MNGSKLSSVSPGVRSDLESGAPVNFGGKFNLGLQQPVITLYSNYKLKTIYSLLLRIRRAFLFENDGMTEII